MPTFQNLPISLIFLSVVLVGLVGAKNHVTFMNSSCSGRGFYAPGGTFEANLDLLLHNFTVGAQKAKFYMTAQQFRSGFTVGETTDHAYGLFLCRGDTTAQVCHDCVMAAANTIQEHCPFTVAAIVWYKECILRYSNLSNFTNVIEKPVCYYHAGALDYVQFNDTISNTFRDLIVSASSGNSSLAFSSKVVNLTSSLTLYCYVECSPDIVGSACEKCLETAIDRFHTSSDGSKYAALLQPSCRLMYDFNGIVAVPDGLKQKGGRESLYLVLLIAVSSASMLICFSSIIFCLYKRKRKRATFLYKGMEDMEKTENLQFDFATIKHVTGNFSEDNRIGRGGFGVVYKGSLPNGQAVAVKRLSLASKQGMQEFKTEVSLLARLQHRNLVKLYGFCVNREEKLLVYELLANKSLERYLADPNKISNLKWETRYKIILGVARGIQYLHEDSRFRIIHRDLKSSNILLDADLNPKISDFGLAKLFELHQTLGDTSTVAGTYGYMAPEYARTGQYSTKSDAFSFGVILLELLSGRMRCSSYLLEEEGFLSHAWRLWTDGKSSEFLDSTIGRSDSAIEATRCVHIGLLCVQEDPSKRPDMALVVVMLNRPSIALPLPTAPLSSLWSSASTGASTSETDMDI